MSWNVNITSKDKEALKTAVRAEHYMPPKLKEMLCDQIDVQRIPEPNEPGHFALHVMSTGHHDSNYCYGDFKVQLTRAV